MALPLDLQAQIAALSGAGDREALLRYQLQQAEALRGSAATPRTTPTGTILSGIGNGLSRFGGIMGAEHARQGLEAVGNQRTQARSDFATQLAALRGDPAGQQQMADLGMLSGDPVLGRMGQGLADQASRAAQAQAERERERRREKLERDRMAAEAKRSADLLALEREKMGAAAGRAEKEAATAAADRGGRLRRELLGNPVVKAAQEVKVAYGKIQRAAKANTPAGDMSMIFAYMKMLDPGSTVREGEYANARNAEGVPGQIINLYNRALEGTLLNPNQRADFLKQAQGLYEEQAAPARSLAGEYAGYAQRLGLNPAEVLPDLGFDSLDTPVAYEVNGQTYRLQADGTYSPE